MSSWTMSNDKKYVISTHNQLLRVSIHVRGHIPVNVTLTMQWEARDTNRTSNNKYVWLFSIRVWKCRISKQH